MPVYTFSEARYKLCLKQSAYSSRILVVDALKNPHVLYNNEGGHRSFYKRRVILETMLMFWQNVPGPQKLGLLESPTYFA